MKISYIIQLKDFFIILLIGFILGIFYGIINIHSHTKKIIILQIICDIIFSIISYFSLLISVNLINNGEFRLFLIVGFILGFIIERITLGKIFAKGYKWVYTTLVKLIKSFANSKLGKVIFK